VTVDNETASLAEQGVAVLLFAVAFVWGGRIHPMRALIHDRRSIISFSAGAAAAYVFVHLMPELHGAHRAFVESVSIPLHLEGVIIYFVALIGFLVFYGLDNLRSSLHKADEASKTRLAFRFHVGGFAAYVWLMAYLLVDNLEKTLTAIGTYAVAIFLHLLTIDHSLREEHGAAYDRVGRYVLAGMALLGWGVALLFALPHHVVALLVAFISGAIIMNSVIMELPSEKDGRFLPFLIGGIVYGLILMPLG
jgi:hypothetical protein